MTYQDMAADLQVTSHFAHMIQGHQDGASAPKSGVIRLEFDKDWIGSKGYVQSLLCRCRSHTPIMD